MKIRLWLVLFVVVLGAGCAPGYYAPKPAYPEEEVDTTGWRRGFWQNPETAEEQRMRIWRMDMSR